MALITEDRDCDVVVGVEPSSFAFGLLNFTVRRESRSFCRNLAGRAVQSFWNAAFFDRPLLIFGVAPPRRADKRWVHDLPGHHDVARSSQRRFKALEKTVDAPALISFSRNNQIVRVSGTRSASESARNLMIHMLSLIRNSSRSSDRCRRRGDEIAAGHLLIHRCCQGFKVIAKFAQPSRRSSPSKKTCSH